MIELRRRIFKLTAQDGYVQDGLIFHLDGKEKTETTWTDLIGGVQFDISNCDMSDNYVRVNQVIDGNKDFESKVLTYEICAYITKAVPNDSSIINSAGAAVYIHYGYTYSRQISAQRMNLFANTGNHILSWNNSNSVDNFSVVNNFGISGQKPPASTGIMKLGGLTSCSYDMNIFSIRLYNRELTYEEILQNQQYDNERFELGL